MSFTEQDLQNLSTLSRIDIKESEKAKMLHDMQAILGYISEINEVEGSLVREQESLFNVVREDVVTRETGSNTATVLAEAPSVKDEYVKVEQVLK